MTMRMLIDARHREETRVAVVKGNRIEEFDFESAEHKQLKGNIYLAKVTRVEPSLQAAFIDYGGNRHGFLAFSEIHPDYYQIPREDREALLREEAEHAEEEERLRAEADEAEDDIVGEEHTLDDGEDDRPEEPEALGDEDHDDDRPARAPKAANAKAEAVREKRMNLRRRYKIQDVIHRRQVLLVQVVKEERGNKGAALTTYLSLAGRYCVLMPNTSHGGGISRKISNAGDRKRLKSIMVDMNLPKTMGCIVRTAGLSRTKTEIRRDFDYLARLWDEVREKTLKSAAPALIYQDSDLIKRAIRDIYNKDIDEVIVEGAEGYAHAKQFMKLLMPSHARRVKPYADHVPLFQRAHVEDQLAAMYNPVVQLKSGGYLVINPTEALVSIDINSGRSTREHGIEATAVGTNLEAAYEIARQLRLRDMAGLVVIDFIDMESNGNIRKVEKAMKAALADDRARIQVGRISSFGLMEMSRQRLRTGVLEASTRQCPHCEGTGLVRTASSAALSALRLLEDEAGRGRSSVLTLRASQEAAFYVLNRKRAELAEIEERFGVRIEIQSDGEVEGARMTVEGSGPPPSHAPRIEAMPMIEDDLEDDIPEDDEDEVEVEVEAREPRQRREGSDEGEGRGRSRRRRRRRGGGRGEGGNGEARDAAEPREPREPAEGVEATEESGEAVGDGEERRGRRGRRGGRRRRGRDSGADTRIEGVEAPAVEEDTVVAEAIAEAPAVEPEPDAGAEAPAPKPRARRPRKAAADTAKVEAVETADVTPEPAVEETPKPKPKRTRKKTVAAETPVEAPVAEAVTEEAPKPKRTRKPKAAPAAEAAAVEAVSAPADTAAEEAVAPEPGEAAPRRRGWWQRTLDTLG
jgi:ribonuclease E